MIIPNDLEKTITDNQTDYKGYKNSLNKVMAVIREYNRKTGVAPMQIDNVAVTDEQGDGNTNNNTGAEGSVSAEVRGDTGEDWYDDWGTD